MSTLIVDDSTKNLTEAIKVLKLSVDNLNVNMSINISRLKDTERYIAGNQTNMNDDLRYNTESILPNINVTDYGTIKKAIKNNELKEEAKKLKSILEDNKTQQEVNKLKTEVQDNTIKNPENMKDALLGAGYKLEREFGTVFTNITTLTSAAAIAMRDNMSNFFFDAMTGKVKSFEEYFQNFVNSIKKAVSQLLSNVIMGSIEKLIFPQKASGGRVASGTPFIAGENGPELINIDGAGATVISNNTTQSMLGGANLAVEVNVINQSGTQMQANQGETRFDMIIIAA